MSQGCVITQKFTTCNMYGLKKLLKKQIQCANDAKQEVNGNKFQQRWHKNDVYNTLLDKKCNNKSEKAFIILAVMVNWLSVLFQYSQNFTYQLTNAGRN